MNEPDTIVAALRRNAELRGDKVYLAFEGSKNKAQLTFGALWTGSEAAAGTLIGLSDLNDTCLIFLPHSPALLTTFFGGILGGRTPAIMPLPSAKQDPQIYWNSHRSLLEKIKPKLVVTTAEQRALLHEMALDQHIGTILTADELGQSGGTVTLPDRAGTDAAFLQHSSGTTGLKKGVILSHGAVMRQVASYARAIDFSDADVIASWLPLYHDMGLITSTVMPAIVGNTVAFVDPFEWLARPNSLFRIIQDYKATRTWLPNFAFEHLTRVVDPARQTYDLGSMRSWISCSEPAKGETARRFLDRFAPFGVTQDTLHICYAAAETVFAMTQTMGDTLRSVTIDPQRLEHGNPVTLMDGGLEVMSTGRAVDGLTCTVRTDAGVVADGAVGEICIEADFLFDGYNKDPATTAERLRDGVYWTRDEGFIIDGELYILGRKDDVIIVNGRNIYAHEIETLLLSIGELKAGRCVAFGSFDKNVGSNVMVIVAETAEPITDEDAQRIVQKQVVELVNTVVSVVPADVRLVDLGWLTKTSSGKVSRSENAKKYALEFGQ